MANLPECRTDTGFTWSCLRHHYVQPMFRSMLTLSFAMQKTPKNATQYNFVSNLHVMHEPIELFLDLLDCCSSFIQAEDVFQAEEANTESVVVHRYLDINRML